jgi:hypothetical protein
MTEHELHSERAAAELTKEEYEAALDDNVNPLAVFEAQQTAKAFGVTETYDDQPAAAENEPTTPVETAESPDETSAEPTAPEAPEETVRPVEDVARPAKPEKKVKVPVPVDLDAVRAAAPKPAGPAVVGNDAVDTVSVAAVVYKNLYARKSLSVHHVQRRLAELGFVESYRDRDGYYADHTRVAVSRFQTDRGLTVTGLLDRRTAEVLFEGDPNVRLTD